MEQSLFFFTGDKYIGTFLQKTFSVSLVHIQPDKHDHPASDIYSKQFQSISNLWYLMSNMTSGLNQTPRAAITTSAVFVWTKTALYSSRRRKYGTLRILPRCFFHQLI